MRICVVGTGYVGLVAATCFAEMGNNVISMDVDEEKIRSLQQGKVPIYEPGLEEMVRRNAEEGRLAFTTELQEGVEKSLLIFIAVGTPAGEDGSSDLRYVLKAAASIAEAMNGYKIIVNKSTVPVGTADRVRQEIRQRTRFEFDVVSNPEFLKEGAAVEDFMKPDRVIIGTEDVRVAEIMKELYAPFTRTGAPILVMDTRSAEMTKYAANAMLASRISFMNEIANLCEHVGADVHWVRQGVGFDRRIGASFLFPGVGYGGSCFPKDIRSLVRVAEEHHFPLHLVKAIEEVNERQKQVLIDKVLRFYNGPLVKELEEYLSSRGVPGLEDEVDRAALVARGPCPVDTDSFPFRVTNQRLRSLNPEGAERGEGSLKGRTFAVWGLSFKPRTDDMREAPSQVIVQELLRLGAAVRAYDPVAMPVARRLFGDSIQYCANNYEALEGADGLVLITEWNVFRNPDFGKMRQLMKLPVIFDGRNQYDPREMRELGFCYFGIGRP